MCAYLNVRSILSLSSRFPPCLLIHGAANSGSVWSFWQAELSNRGCGSHALDLRGHGRSGLVDLSITKLQDYVEDVCTVASKISQSPVLIGWSMGGLVAMMAATKVQAKACIALAPSVPKRESDFSVQLRRGVFNAEEYLSGDWG